MSNMSYCRFQNTLNDLRDCEEALHNGALEELEADRESDKNDRGSNVHREWRSAVSLIKLCKTLASDFSADIAE